MELRQITKLQDLVFNKPIVGTYFIEKEDYKNFVYQYWSWSGNDNFLITIGAVDENIGKVIVQEKVA